MSITFSKKLKAIRDAEDLTQKSLAERSGVSQKAIINYENEVRQPNFEAVQKLCNTFSYYTMYLMFDEMPANVGADQITPEEKKLRDLSTSEKTA